MRSSFDDQHRHGKNVDSRSCGPVIAAQVDMSMAQAQLLIRKKGYMGLPVVNDGRLVGMLSRRDYKHRNE